MNKIFATSILTTMAFSVFAQSVVDEIVWVVGDEAILLSDVEEQRLRSQYEGSAPIGDPYCTIPEMLATQKLFLDQAALDSISADDKQVQQQVDQRISYLESQIGSKDRLEAYFGKKMDKIDRGNKLGDMLQKRL